MREILNLSPILIEVFGYIASTLVLISFLFKNVKTIRIVNVCGALFFVLYGYFTKTYPTMLMNFALIFVHFYYLYKSGKNKDKPI